MDVEESPPRPAVTGAGELQQQQQPHQTKNEEKTQQQEQDINEKSTGSRQDADLDADADAGDLDVDIEDADTASDPLLLVEEQQLHGIKEPHSNDVLCGRGVTTNRFPGNCSFRSLVGVNKELYVSSTKREKMKISRSIVQAVRSLNPPGRFLDRDPDTGLWNDIGHKKAIEKTSQALRDGAATLRKQLSADLGDPDFLNTVFNDDEIEVTIPPSYSAEVTSVATPPRKAVSTGSSSATSSNQMNNAHTAQQKQLNKRDHNNGGDRNKNSPKKPTTIKASEKRTKGHKVKTPPAKKGHHRRVKSNPSSLAQVIAADKAQRRLRAQQEEEYRRYRRFYRPDGHMEGEPLDAEGRPTSPSFHVYRHHHHMYPPPSSEPPSPHPTAVRSLPNSPMSWGGYPPARYPPDGPDVGQPYPHHPHHHPHFRYPPPPGYHHPTSPPPGYLHERYGRSHSFDHPHQEAGPSGPPPRETHLSPPRHHSWSPYVHHRSPHHRYHPHHAHDREPPTPLGSASEGHHRRSLLPPPTPLGSASEGHHRRSLLPPPTPLGSASEGHHRRSLPPPSPRRDELSPREVRSPSPQPKADAPTKKSLLSSSPTPRKSNTPKSGSGQHLSPESTTDADHDIAPIVSTSSSSSSTSIAKSKVATNHNRTPEWSPRRVNYHLHGGSSNGGSVSSHSQSSFTPPTPGRFFRHVRHPEEYTPPERSASWSDSPRYPLSHSPLTRGNHPHFHHHSDHQRSRSNDVDVHGDRRGHEDDDGLHVPALGDESRQSKWEKDSAHQGRSPRLHLAPRSRPFPMDKIPHPTSPSHDVNGSFSPPPLGMDGGSDRLRREFIPPRFSPKLRRSPTSPPEERSIRGSFHCSPVVEEEKKMTDVEAKEDVTMMPTCTSDPVLSSPNKDAKVGSGNHGCAGRSEKGPHRNDVKDIKSGHKCADTEQYMVGRVTNEKDGTKTDTSNPNDVVIAMDEDGEGIETVISHGGVKVSGPDEKKSRHNDEGDQHSHHSIPEAECVDDIAMSPLPYDREDPVSLMALPDDIMTLPISPCGPHDEHGTAAS